MSDQVDVSVILSTYNRCEVLPPALASLLAQEADGVRYEVIIVDNNSTDGTRQVVEAFIARGHPNVRYVFEGKQGLAHGRNAGIANARAPLVAFTDDDVRVAPDWVASIKRAFAEHAEVDCVGGKILPQWKAEPPSWLTRDLWVGSLALQDYGDEPFNVNAERPIALAGANLAFRREVFQRIGLFAADVSVGADKSDTELLVRFWRSSGQSRYVPDIIAVADVQTERMTKAYHRRWYATNGKFNALMRLEETFDSRGRLLPERPDVVRLFGVPTFVYRALMTEGGRWLLSAMQRQGGRSFMHEIRARYFASYIRKGYELDAAVRQHSPLAEVGAFAKTLLQKKGWIASRPYER